MGESIIMEIQKKLLDMGLLVEMDKETALFAKLECVESGWSSPRKQMVYEIAVYEDTNETTVYLCEKISEISSGFVLKETAERESQHCMHMTAQYGPDGTARSYVIDIESIPSAIGEVARAKGWKFKIVTHKPKTAIQEKLAVEKNVMEPVALERSDHASVAAKPFLRVIRPHNKGEQGYRQLAGLVGYFLLGFAMVVWLLLARASILGWALSMGIYGVAFFKNQKSKSKNTWVDLGIWAGTVVLLLIVLGITASRAL